jgi:hypothetical protein
VPVGTPVGSSARVAGDSLAGTMKDASEDALVARILRKRPELAETLEGASREVVNYVALEWERRDNDARWAGY